MKRAEGINIDYFLKHSEDIINNTDVLLPEWLFWGWNISDDKKLREFWIRLVEKHRNESGNWFIFSHKEDWIMPYEICQEARDRIVIKYCESTGHWDLFLWEEI